MIQGSIRTIHFVGIGGTGMCGLAEILLTLGYRVTGSDLMTHSDAVARLTRLGAQVAEGHAAENIGSADLLVISSAIRPNNPEVVAAREASVPILKRGQMLAEIMRLKYSIAVAGAHGKTTTTSFIGHVLSHAGLDPTVVVGGRLRSIQSNARVGAGDIFVAEADESDGSFLEILPTIGIITNIDREHLDHYRNLEAIQAAFLRFAASVPFYGAAVVCGDDERVRAILPQINRPVILYGFGEDCSVRALQPRTQGDHSTFRVEIDGEDQGEFRVPLPGRHNILNTLACIAVARYLDVTIETIRAALASFAGVGRRFETRGEVAGVTHVDDYGHHPTEILAVLRAAREAFGTRRLVVIFQPHRYTRTAALHDEFADAFCDADLVVLSDIYAAGEMPIQGVSGELLKRQIVCGSKVEVVYAPEEEDAIAAAASRLTTGDVLLTLGAGNVWAWGDEAMQRLRTALEQKVGES